MLRLFYLALLGTALTACGSSTSGQIDTSVGDGATIVNDLALSTPENIELVYSFDFNQDPNDNVITYAVTGGADEALLSVGLLNTSEIKFDDAPDFENPGDADADNVYELEITGTLISSGRSASQLVYITVTDVEAVVAAVNPFLNDTGVTLCGDFSAGATHNNDIDCTDTASDADPVPAQQDAQVGRDALDLDKTGAGPAAFDFTKLNEDAEPLPANTIEWFCVKDNVTGLIWETKQDSGLHSDSQADTYVINTNSVTLCGADTWRLPTHTELLGLLDYGADTSPLTSSQFFLNAQTDAAYRASTSSTATGAWAVSFDDATMSNPLASTALAIRLVRGE